MNKNRIKEITVEINNLEDSEREKVINQIISAYKGGDTLSSIMDFISVHFNITTTEILSQSRKGELILPRHLIMYFARKKTTLNFEKIGHFCGERNHTTAINACKKIERLMTEKKEIADLVAILDNKMSKTFRSAQ